MPCTFSFSPSIFSDNQEDIGKICNRDKNRPPAPRQGNSTTLNRTGHVKSGGGSTEESLERNGAADPVAFQCRSDALHSSESVLTSNLLLHVPRFCPICCRKLSSLDWSIESYTANEPSKMERRASGADIKHKKRAFKKTGEKGVGRKEGQKTP